MEDKGLLEPRGIPSLLSLCFLLLLTQVDRALVATTVKPTHTYRMHMQGSRQDERAVL